MLKLATSARKLKITAVLDAAPFGKLGVPLEAGHHEGGLRHHWAIATEARSQRPMAGLLAISPVIPPLPACLRR
jgi:hypothetical protein